MNIPDGPAARAGIALLALGYPVSIVVLVRLLPVLRQRRRPWFGAGVAGLGCLVVGWALLGRPVPAAVNGVGLAALMVTWAWRGRPRR